MERRAYALDRRDDMLTLLLFTTMFANESNAKLYRGPVFEVRIPPGYEEISDRRDRARVLAYVATESGASIVFQRAPSGTGSDAGACAQTSKTIANASEGKVVSAGIVRGPAGKGCQMHIVAPAGVTFITELNKTSETWVMTCSHMESDTAADKACRSALRSFSFNTPPPSRVSVR
jgi:hypothetical protein